MNSSSLSAEDLRTCAFVSLICPMRSMASEATKAPPRTPIALAKSADRRVRSLACAAHFRVPSASLSGHRKYLLFSGWTLGTAPFKSAT